MTLNGFPLFHVAVIFARECTRYREEFPAFARLPFSLILSQYTVLLTVAFSCARS